MTLIDDGVGTTATETEPDAAEAPTLTDTSRSEARRPGGGRHGAGGAAVMRVKKRNGSLEPVDLNKIVNAIARASEGLLGVDPMRVATRTISALADGASTRELDDLSIRTAAGLIVEEPNYSKLASRLLATVIDKEVRNQNIPWFSESIKVGHAEGSSPTRARLRRGQRARAQRGDQLRPRPPVRVLRPAHGLRPLPAPPPASGATSSRPRSTSSCASPAACRPTSTRRSRSTT